MISDLHFIRPLWLLATIPLFALWFLLRRQTDVAQPWRNIIAPHLLPFLLSVPQNKQSGRSLFSPLNLIALGWLIAVLAIAGPTWRHEPAPFADDTAALAIVIRISPTMKTEDVQPSRLARATEKIHDLLTLRPGAKTILIAYAGTAHTVMPATTDAGIINTFAQALDPRIMPSPDGDAATDALALATRALTEAGGGSILWITDSLSPDQVTPLTDWRKTTRTPVYLYPPLLSGTERDTLLATTRPADAHLVQLTPDDADVRSIASTAKFSTRASNETGTRWAETAYWLTPLLALLLLPFFRRGWMLATAAAGGGRVKSER